MDSVLPSLKNRTLGTEESDGEASEEEEASDTEGDKPSDTEGHQPQVWKPELEDMIQLCDDGDRYEFTSDFLDKWVDIQSPLLKEVPSNHVNTDRFYKCCVPTEGSVTPTRYYRSSNNFPHYFLVILIKL